MNRSQHVFVHLNLKRSALLCVIQGMTAAKRIIGGKGRE